MTIEAKIFQSANEALLEFLSKFHFDENEQEYLEDYINSITIPDPIIKKYDYRCPHCARLAFRACLGDKTKIAHRCAKCGRMLTFSSNGKKIQITTEEKETTTDEKKRT